MASKHIETDIERRPNGASTASNYIERMETGSIRFLASTGIERKTETGHTETGDRNGESVPALNGRPKRASNGPETETNLYLERSIKSRDRNGASFCTAVIKTDRS
jgi:hypothetical protein